MPVEPEHEAGGPVYFAWVTAAETTFTEEHLRYDEYIFSFDRILAEGKLPVLSVTMKNPGQLLTAGLGRWAWLAWDDGVTVHPLFFGRVVAIPSDLQAEIIQVQFIAKPTDLAARKIAAAAPLKVLPNYDEIFVDAAYHGNPDVVLKGYSAAWCHDPVTHAVTAEDLLVGSAGTITFAAGDIFYDSLKTTIGAAPLRVVTMKVTVGWTQQATGGFEIPDSPVLITYDGGAAVNSWPKPGAAMGQGWFIDQASATDANDVANVSMLEGGFHFEDRSKSHRNGDLIKQDVTWSQPSRAGVTVEVTSDVQNTIGDPDTGKAASTNVNVSTTYAIESLIHTELSVRYEASRERSETLTFTIHADLQPVLGEPDETVEAETIALSGADVGVAIDGIIPIVDLSRRAYFPTERGRQSRDYAACVGRARIVESSRAYGVNFDCPFAAAEPVRLNKNGALSERRVAGGAVLGKIVETRLKCDGPAGVMIGSIVLGCAVGNGTAFAEVEGTPTCVDASCLGPDCQLFLDRIVALPTGDIGLSQPIESDDSDDGLRFPLTRDAVITANGLTDEGTNGSTWLTPQRAGAVNTLSGQVDALTRQASGWNAAAAISNKWTYRLALKPVTNGPFNDEYAMTASPLSLPKQVDLGAS